MQLKEYKAIRESGKELGSEIFKFITENHKNDLMAAAKLLGFWNGKIMVFEKEMDVEILMDFMVFEKTTSNVPAFKRYFDSCIKNNYPLLLFRLRRHPHFLFCFIAGFTCY